MSDQEGVYQLTAPVMMVRQNLITPKAFTQNGKEQGAPKFDVTFAFAPDHPDFQPLRQLIGQVARRAFPELSKEEFAALAFPFRKGEVDIAKAEASAKKNNKKAPDLKHFEGKHLLTARTGAEYPPDLVVDINGKPVTLDRSNPAMMSQHKNKFWTGQMVFGQVKFKAHPAVGGNKAGVNVYLHDVYATGAGTRIGGERDAAAKYQGYRGKVSQEDPGSNDDAIPY